MLNSGHHLNLENVGLLKWFESRCQNTEKFMFFMFAGCSKMFLCVLLIWSRKALINISSYEYVQSCHVIFCTDVAFDGYVWECR